MTDNNNFEEFEHVEGEHAAEHLATPPKGIRANLGGAWRSQPLFKLFVLMVIVAAIVAVLVALFSGDKGKSQVGLLKPPDMHEAPGGKSSPYLKEQTEMANKQRTEEAIQSGGSALPTPLGPGNDTNELNPAAPKDDPLNELRAEVENMNKQLQEAKQQAAAPPPGPAQQEPFDDSLSQAMQRQMGQLLDSWAPKGVKQIYGNDIEFFAQERSKKLQLTSVDAGKKDESAGGKGAAGATQAAKTIVPAGTVSYAQLLTEANSDVPGPILGQIVSGPLKGARIVGNFQVANNYSDYLIMTFKLADLNGTDYKIYAIALDPDTTLGGMATEVDQRYLERLVLPAAAGFLSGFAGAIGHGDQNIITNGTTTVITQSKQGIHEGIYNGIGAAAQTASQFFTNQANQTKPLVRVAAGTPMGLFFVNTVTDQPITQADAQNQNQQINPMTGQPYPPGTMGQPGTMGNLGLNASNNFGGQIYGNGYGGGGGYPVLYPSAAAQGAGLGYNSYGQLNTNPGSTVYFGH